MLSPLFSLFFVFTKNNQAGTVDFTANHQDGKKKKDFTKSNTTELLTL